MSEWIEHDGGLCPVALHAMVQAKNRRGEVCVPFAAAEMDWEHEGDDYDIIAYRIAQPEAREGEAVTTSISVPAGVVAWHDGSKTEFQPAQPRQHISDAAWARLTPSVLPRETAERNYSGRGLMIVTAQEWEARDGWAKQEALALYVEIADLRTQLAAKDAIIGMLTRKSDQLDESYRSLTEHYERLLGGKPDPEMTALEAEWQERQALARKLLAAPGFEPTKLGRGPVVMERGA